jgi:hypothetical protein
MSLTSTTDVTKTTLPSWYTNAQSGIAAAGLSGFSGAMNTANQTVGNQLISDFSGASNPFNTATGNLTTIQSGLMNPFLSQAQGGGFNMNSPLGALFSAQNAKLDQVLPQITAKEGAVGLGGGNFGSLRGQTATGAARAGALTTLAEGQRKTALDAFGQATQAAQAQGNVASQQARELLPLAKYEQTGGLDALQKYADVMGSMAKTLDTTVTTTKQGSALENMQKVGAFLNQAGLTADKIATGSTGISWFDRMVTGKNADGVTVVTPEQAAADQAQLQSWLQQYELSDGDDW